MSADQAGHAFPDYTQFLNDYALQGTRIGVWRAGTYDPALVGLVVEPILDHTIAALEAQVGTVIDGTDIDLSATVNEFPALLCEFKTDIATYLQTYVHGTNPVSGQWSPQALSRARVVPLARAQSFSIGRISVSRCSIRWRANTELITARRRKKTLHTDFSFSLPLTLDSECRPFQGAKAQRGQLLPLNGRVAVALH